MRKWRWREEVTLFGNANPDVKLSARNAYGGLIHRNFLDLPVRSSLHAISQRNLTTSSPALASSDDDGFVGEDTSYERLNHRPIGFNYTGSYALFCMHNRLPPKEGSYIWNSTSMEERKKYGEEAMFTEQLRKKWYKELSPPVKRVLMKSRKVKTLGKRMRAELLQIFDELRETLKQGPESDRVTWRKILENGVLTKSGLKLWVEREVILKPEKKREVDEEDPSDRELNGSEFDEMRTTSKRTSPATVL